MLIYIAIITLSLLFFWGLRNSALGVSLKKGNLAGLLLFKEIFIFVLLGVFLIHLYGIERFNTLRYVEDESVEKISWLIIYATLSFLISLMFFSRFIFKNALEANGNIDSAANHKKIYFFSIYLLIIFVGLIFAIFIFFDFKHAFLGAIFNGFTLKEVRMMNKYESNAPSFVISLITYIGYLLTILAGSSIFSKHKKIRYLMMIATLFFSASSGAKSPVLNTLILYFISYFTFSGKKIGGRAIIASVAILMAILGLAIGIVKLQFPNYTTDEYITYFVNRIGVGQIGGTYEQFNLKIQSSTYIYHAIPFGSFFYEYTPFQKDLMIISENVKNPLNTGVKNTLFLAEASAIGGWQLALASPFIVAFNYTFSFFLISMLFRYLIFNNKYFSIKVCSILFLQIAPLTGGFSEWLFLKLLINYLLFSLFFLIPFNILWRLSNTIRTLSPLQRAP